MKIAAEEIDKAMHDLMIYGAYVMVLQPDGSLKCAPYAEYWAHMRKNPPAR